MRLAGNAKGVLAGAIVIACGLLGAISPVTPADAAFIVDHGVKPAVGKARGAAAIVISEAPARRADTPAFWTAARIAAAEPVAGPAPPGSALFPSASPAASLSAASGDFTPESAAEFPHVLHGKVLFTVGPDLHSCSGTLVETSRRNVVFTAGHCVYDRGSGSFVGNLIFIPGYEHGPQSLGFASAVNLYTTTQWVEQGATSYDIGVVVLDRPLQNRIGARKIAFDLNARGLDYTLYGYPSKPSPPFDGEVLQGCRAEVIGQDNERGSIVRFPALDRRRNVIPFALAAQPCHMQQGASGGGWVTLRNYLNSMVSYSYCESLPHMCDTIFGPYFSNAAKALYVEAGGSIAPTVRLLRAPRRIVRTRRVSFRFGGTASTLLGFRCRLDRRRWVPCSARISITRLRPGRHVLRVRSVDQTGKVSRRQIVRPFRVILRRR